MSKIAEMAEGIIATVKSYVDAAVKPLLARIDEVQKSIPPAVDVEQIAKDAAAQVPQPDFAALRKEIEMHRQEEFQAFLTGVKSETEGLASDVAEVAAEARKALESLRQPEDGKDADPQVVIDAVVKQIRQPEDGKSVTVEDVLPAFEKAFGQWALDFERRAQDLFQKAVEKIPAPKNGVDGFGFDDLSVEFDGERGLTIKFSQGERVKEFPFTLPVVLDRGVFKEGDDYQKGDGVTWGGSFFIAQKDNPQGKPGESDAWRLSCKRGRDGKNYEPPVARPQTVSLS